MLLWPLLLLLSGAVLSLHAAEWYVSPNASSSGNGSQSNPWRLQTALDHPSSVKPGDTIWLRGGTYTGSYDSRLVGTASAPIIVRQYPGERAKIDGLGQHSSHGSIFIVRGSYVWFWGFEVMSSNTDRSTSSTSSSPPGSEIPVGQGIEIAQGSNITGVKFINMLVHDTRQGFSLWQNAIDAEVYGCLVYYNGWRGGERAHGHGFYLQNQSGRKYIRDCFIFDQFGFGLHAYGESAPIDNITSERNFVFRNGYLDAGNESCQILIGGAIVARNPVIHSNYLFAINGTNLRLGYGSPSQNASVIGNYVAGFDTRTGWGADMHFGSPPSGLVMTGNRFYVEHVTGINPSSYPNNTWVRNGNPTTSFASMHVNAYENNRANVIVYNWANQQTVPLSVSGFLNAGNTYELRNVYNYYGDVITGTYSGGGTINIPMTGRTISQPSGWTNPQSPYPRIGAFVLIRQGSGSGGGGGGGGGNTAPTISSISDITVSPGTSTGPLSFTVSDAQTSASNLTITRSSSSTSLVPTANIVLGGSGANRTVTVTPAANQTGTATITLTVSDGSLTASTSFRVTVSAQNTPPTISAISDRTIPANTSTGPIAFTVSDAQTSASNLTVTRSSSNTTLVPTSNILLGGSGANRTVTVTPVSNRTGSATITIRVSDGSLTTTTSFVVTVTTGNTPPTISSIPNQTITRNSSTGPLSFTVSDAQTSASNLTITRSSSNTSLVPTTRIVLGGSGANRTVTVTPADNRTGTATITLTVSDGSLTASRSFVVTVTETSSQGVYLMVEAENATLVSPMRSAFDSSASGDRYIYSTTSNSGTATFAVNIPTSGEYTIWSRVRSANDGQDSFFVSVDGGAEDVFDTAEGSWSNTWQWTTVNGRNGGAPMSINPRRFNLSAGNHTIRFRGRETNTRLDAILVTNDRNYVPNPPSAPSGLRFTN